jgi:ribokinase
MKVLNMGSLNLDHVYQVNHFIQPGETEAALGYDIFPGGKGLNQSIALSRAGCEVYHAGVLGKGSQLLEECLKEANVKISYMKYTEVSQGHAIIQVNRNGENCIIICAGSNHEFDKNYIDTVLTEFGSDTFLVLQNEINNLDYIIDKAYEIGMKIILNPSPMDDRMRLVDFNKITWLLLNEVEGEGITGKQSPDDILNQLKGKFPDTNIVLTLGRKGSVCICGEGKFHQDIFQVEAVDTTAAGDTYTGYLVACMAEGKSIKDALRYASAASAISVTRNGASSSVPVRQEVEAFLNDN